MTYISSQMMRQGANSAVRFTTYTTLKQFVQSTARPGQQLPTGITFAIGAIAGLVTVYVTQPLEYVFCLVTYAMRLPRGIVSSRRACSLSVLPKSTRTRSIVVTAS